MKKKIYIRRQPGPSFGRSLCEDGTFLDSDQYDEHCGVGNWEVEYVDDEQSHFGWCVAYRKNNDAYHAAIAREYGSLD